MRDDRMIIVTEVTFNKDKERCRIGIWTSKIKGLTARECPCDAHPQKCWVLTEPENIAVLESIDELVDMINGDSNA